MCFVLQVDEALEGCGQFVTVRSGVRQKLRRGSMIVSAVNDLEPLGADGVCRRNACEHSNTRGNPRHRGVGLPEGELYNLDVGTRRLGANTRVFVARRSSAGLPSQRQLSASATTSSPAPFEARCRRL